MLQYVKSKKFEIEVPPFDLLTVYPNGSFHYAGSSRLIIEWLAIKLNFTLVFVLPTEQEAKERGNEAPLDMVANGVSICITLLFV